MAKDILTIEEISKGIRSVVVDYPVKKAALFGSYADGKATKESDVDLLVEFMTPTVSLFMLSDLRMRIEEALSKKVDIIHGPLANDAMIEINKEVPIYEA